VSLVTLSVLVLAACNSSKAAVPPPPPPPVSFVTVSPRSVTLGSEWVATLDGFVNAQIRPQVSGYLTQRTYREGAAVQKGQVLFEIDPRPFEAAVAQARARLAEAQVQLGRTERDLQRDKPLAEQRAIAQSQLDNDILANLAAQAALKSAAAAVDVAELNLGFTKVTSLTGGIAAIATAQIGDLVGPTTLLTTVSQIDPIKAYFSLSEQEYLKVADRINAPGAPKSLWPGGSGLALILADGTRYPHAGAFFAADRQIDEKTGTIRISATFPNPSGTLRPGQYGKVHADTHTIAQALLVPQRAVSELQGVRQVKIIDSSNRVATRTIQVGERLGPEWLVERGLAAGDRVIVEGVAATDGAVVSPTPFKPAAEIH
jgi:membrane fusion protein (multidrug efflux system)